LELWRLTLELWRLTLELWRLTLELWRLTMELWRLTLELWRLTIEQRNLAGILETCPGDTCTRTKARSGSVRVPNEAKWIYVPET
jgi:hypothetical protein